MVASLFTGGTHFEETKLTKTSELDTPGMYTKYQIDDIRVPGDKVLRYSESCQS